MGSLAIPSKLLQYVNDIKGATTQYTGIIGVTATINENPLAVQTLLDWCVSQGRTGLVLYSIDSSPYWNGGTTFTSLGVAKIRDFVSRANARGLEVGFPWNCQSTNFAQTCINYNNVVTASERVTILTTEDEFWSSNTKQTLLDMISVINSIKAACHTSGIFIYGYLGFTHSAGYQYPGDSTPITTDELVQLQGVLDFFMLHCYTKLWDYAYVRNRVRQFTVAVNGGWINSDETPDNNATGGFDPTNSYFGGWTKEGRDTSITPIIPNNPPPVIYSPKNLTDFYNYVTHVLTLPHPTQSGSPIAYDADADPNAANMNVMMATCFAWRYSHPLALAQGIPPAPPPSGLLPYSELPATSQKIARDILLTLLNDPSAPVTPSPSDYGELHATLDQLLYDILVAINALQPTPATIAPVSITIAQAIAKDTANSWVNGQMYRITNPTNPLVSFTSQALYNPQIGQIRLSVNGTAYIKNKNGTTHSNTVYCEWDFNNPTDIYCRGGNNVEVKDRQGLGSNGLLWTDWNNEVDNRKIDIVVSDSGTNALDFIGCNLEGTVIAIASTCEMQYVTDINGIYQTSIDGNNFNNIISEGATQIICLGSGDINNVHLFHGSLLSVTSIDGLTLEQAATFGYEDATCNVALNCYVSAARDIIVYAGQNALSGCVVNDNESTFIFDYDLSGGGTDIAKLPNNYGIINFVHDAGAINFTSIDLTDITEFNIINFKNASGTHKLRWGAATTNVSLPAAPIPIVEVYVQSRSDIATFQLVHSIYALRNTQSF